MATYRIVKFDHSPAYVQLWNVADPATLRFQLLLLGDLYMPPGACIDLNGGDESNAPYIDFRTLSSAVASIFSSLLLIYGDSPDVTDSRIFPFRPFYRESVSHVEPTGGDMVQYYAYVEYLAPWTLYFGLRTDSNIPELARVYAQILFPKDHFCNSNRSPEWLTLGK